MVDCYWRKYTTSSGIPKDAFVAATVNSLPVYIGRAPYKNNGLIVGEFVPQTTGIPIPGYPPGCGRRVYKFIEILCTPHPEFFEWVSATARTLHEHKNLVQGGFEVKDGEPAVLYIGRTGNTARRQVGKVVGFMRGHEEKYNILYLCDDANKEVTVPEYEVLAFKHLC